MRELRDYTIKIRARLPEEAHAALVQVVKDFAHQAQTVASLLANGEKLSVTASVSGSRGTSALSLDGEGDEDTPFVDLEKMIDDLNPAG